MFGGAEMLVPLKEPFIENLGHLFNSFADSPEVQQQIKNQLHQGDTIDLLQPKIAAVVEGRLAELTPGDGERHSATDDPSAFRLAGGVGRCVWCSDRLSKQYFASHLN